MRVLVLGAGFRWLGNDYRGSPTSSEKDVDVVLIDRADRFVFGFSKLDVNVRRHCGRCCKPPLSRHSQARSVHFVPVHRAKY